MYSKILVPLVGSPTAEFILPEVQELAKPLGAEVLLFQAVPSLRDIQAVSHIAMDIATKAVEEDRARALEYLQQVASRLRAAGVNVTTHIGEGPAAPAILAHCRQHDVSLVAITTHGRSGLRRTLFGSVADEVMRDSHLPLLVRRPTA
jgi:nucleotide-binding universal stress UspA family protein